MLQVFSFNLKMKVKFLSFLHLFLNKIQINSLIEAKGFLGIVPKCYKRPNDAQNTCPGIRISDELPPNHDENEPCHDTSR